MESKTGCGSIMLTKWDERFFKIALEAASWSKDPKTKVGAVLVSPDKREVSWGFNGFPKKLKDDRRLTSKSKNCFTVHAELNAILNAKKDLIGWTLYVTKFPCHNCALAISQAGIARLVCPPIDTNSKWKDSNLQALQIFEESNIDVFVKK